MSLDMGLPLIGMLWIALLFSPTFSRYKEQYQRDNGMHPEVWARVDAARHAKTLDKFREHNGDSQ